MICAATRAVAQEIIMDEHHWMDGGCLFCGWRDTDTGAQAPLIFSYIFSHHGYCCGCGKRIV